jgi:hypothetical protein
VHEITRNVSKERRVTLPLWLRMSHQFRHAAWQ